MAGDRRRSHPIIDAWDRLPEAVRAGIVAMVKAASECGIRI
jgi:hypothetical protein